MCIHVHCIAHLQNCLVWALPTRGFEFCCLFVFKERELALKFFSTLSGVKTDKLDTLGQKLKHNISEGNYEICDTGKIEEALETLARYVK